MTRPCPTCGYQKPTRKRRDYAIHHMWRGPLPEVVVPRFDLDVTFKPWWLCVRHCDGRLIATFTSEAALAKWLRRNKYTEDGECPKVAA